ncbi:MAG: class I SAM-dependent methyltransferase [bacterium]|nr:class I SAM-dependent methyltransferase [bacterium]
MTASQASPIYRRDNCRLCAGGALDEVLSLRPTPPANAFVTAAERTSPQACFPLDLFLCRTCGHLQLLDVVDPEILFRNYVYVSGTSPVFVEHFRRYAEWAIGAWGLKPGDLVVDIGSNDGSFLRFFQAAGMRTLGVDPATAIAEKASAEGIETIPAFFTPELAARIREEKGKAALIAANNVFAHADDLAGIAEGVRSLLAPGGVFTFEVSYLADVYENILFDMTYHEHLAYHSAAPLRNFFPLHGMELIEALRIDTHGGSLRGAAQRAGGTHAIGASVGERIRHEKNLGLAEAETFREFGRRIEARKEELRSLLDGFLSEGKKIAGFGAPAKLTTLMYHFELGPETIDFIVDDSPLKQGLFTPGLHIPVLPSSAIYEKKPDYVVVLAWNFADSIIERHRKFLDSGGHFIVPLPQLQVI